MIGVALLLVVAGPASVLPEPPTSYLACLRYHGAGPADEASEAGWRAAWAGALKACRDNRLVWSRQRLEALAIEHPDWTEAHALNNIEFVTLKVEASAYARFRHPIRIGPTISDRFIWK
jgi:hypothetical protein